MSQHQAGSAPGFVTAISKSDRGQWRQGEGQCSRSRSRIQVARERHWRRGRGPRRAWGCTAPLLPLPAPLRGRRTSPDAPGWPTDHRSAADATKTQPAAQKAIRVSRKDVGSVLTCVENRAPNQGVRGEKEGGRRGLRVHTKHSSTSDPGAPICTAIAFPAYGIGRN